MTAALHPIQSRRLWSLWDMLKINASAFYRVAAGLRTIEGVMQGHRSKSPNDPIWESPFTGGNTTIFKKSAKELRPELKALNATLTNMALDGLLKDIDKKQCTYRQLGERLNDIHSRLRDELKLINLFVLDNKKQGFFSPDEPLFGKEHDTRLSAAAFEVDEAGKCLALSRAMEVGIRAAARCLSIPDPIKDAERNWGAILRNIKDALDARNQNKPAWKTPDDRELFAASYAALDSVRLAWRNTTMHVENKYTDEEAEHVFTTVRGFMKKLSARMDENGLPLA
jgi:hypothetical protein